ncbi:MAG TPA: TetR family transcriptional regulator, partial [Vicinamibacteria bacterium]|nr:TetR family transcriptional regulator [Vicinamibacteria bacterium]
MMTRQAATRAPAARERERRDPAATRQALLRAGGELFSERGFDGVPIEDIAARAGVNKALISYHFRGKRGLYLAVLESSFAEMAARLETIEAGAGSAREALRGLLEAFAAFRRERPDFPTLFVREVLATGIEEAVLPHMLAVIGVSRRLAERGAREGLFRRVDPLLLHFFLVGSLVFFFATEPARRAAVAKGLVPFAMPDPGAFVRFVEETTLRGLAPSGRPS